MQPNFLVERVLFLATGYMTNVTLFASLNRVGRWPAYAPMCLDCHA